MTLIFEKQWFYGLNSSRFLFLGTISINYPVTYTYFLFSSVFLFTYRVLGSLHVCMFLAVLYSLFVCWRVWTCVCEIALYVCVGTALHCTRSKCIQGNIKLDIKTKLQFNFVWTVEFCWRAGTVCAWDGFTTRQGNRNSFVFGFQLHYITRCYYYTIKGFSN